MVPDLAALIDAVVYAQRDSTTNDVAEIAEREPGCNIATTLVLLGVSCGDVLRSVWYCTCTVAIIDILSLKKVDIYI